MPERVLITGASRGLGLAMARFFAEQGWEVIATARHPEASTELSSLAAESSSNGSLHLLPLDVRSQESVRAAFATVSRKFDALDVLINNAGVHPERGDETFEDFELDYFQESYATNLVGAARCCQVFRPLLEASSRARIVNMSSGSGSISNRDNHRRYGYGASKAALNHFTRSLAHDWKGKGIAVVAISPGWVKTDMGGEGAPLEIAEAVDQLSRTIMRIGMENSGMFLDRSGNHEAYAW